DQRQQRDTGVHRVLLGKSWTIWPKLRAERYLESLTEALAKFVLKAAPARPCWSESRRRRTPSGRGARPAGGGPPAAPAEAGRQRTSGAPARWKRVALLSR